jgi:hypothetical protein
MKSNTGKTCTLAREIRARDTATESRGSDRTTQLRQRKKKLREKNEKQELNLHAHRGTSTGLNREHQAVGEISCTQTDGSIKTKHKTQSLSDEAAQKILDLD